MAIGASMVFGQSREELGEENCFVDEFVEHSRALQLFQEVFDKDNN